jgi:hypothetical protein
MSKKLPRAGIKSVSDISRTAIDHQDEAAPSERERPPEKRLSVMVPADVMRQIKRTMADEDATTRTVVLRALQQAGYDIPEDEIADRRVEANRERARR